MRTRSVAALVSVLIPVAGALAQEDGLDFADERPRIEAALDAGWTGDDAPAADEAFSFDVSLGTLSPGLPAEPMQASWQDVKPRGEGELVGYFARVGGLVTNQQNDGRAVLGGDPVTFNTGGGVSLAIGYRLGGDVPLTLEGEFAYHYIDADDASGGDGNIRLLTLVFNVLLDLPDVVGPVGFYAGIGAGFKIDRFAFSSSGGSGSAAISGSGFFWQAKGGLTVSITPRTQLYGGVFWADGGDANGSNYTVDIELLGAEFGVRVFF